ncbi:MAG: M24 family metallopeptidase [Gammaproteobacteria bacterium]|nr:MAG: M24 family metallopeptidase [Gammaproteobacteria bacterium]
MQREFHKRRQRLFRLMDRDGIAVLFSASEQQRNADVHYPFRQHSDFYYLTGCVEPHAIALLEAKNRQFILFCEENDEFSTQWTGKKLGPEGAVECLGADEAYPINAADGMIPERLAGHKTLYFPLGGDDMHETELADWIQQIRSQARGGLQPPKRVIPAQELLHELRLFKSPAEIRLMKQAASISAKAHISAMRACRPGQHEYHLESIIQAECMQAGCRFQAYPPIVAAGDNACVLHYTHNNALMQDGDLVLIDAGAELHNYASDITRTFPVNGRFSPAQRALYDLVLEAQLAAIRQVKPGRSFIAPHQAAVKVITRGLLELGLLSRRLDLKTHIQRGSYRRFFMHRTSHWLGLDVHDVGAYKQGKRWRTLQPGMVLTIEPGLYIPKEQKGVARKWQGIGIRIEDDVLVTPTGHDILSKAAPKKADEIEALMAS